jgi:hypothetical protein
MHRHLVFAKMIYFNFAKKIFIAPTPSVRDDGAAVSVDEALFDQRHHPLEVDDEPLAPLRNLRHKCVTNLS